MYNWYYPFYCFLKAVNDSLAFRKRSLKNCKDSKTLQILNPPKNRLNAQLNSFTIMHFQLACNDKTENNLLHRKQFTTVNKVPVCPPTRKTSLNINFEFRVMLVLV